MSLILGIFTAEEFQQFTKTERRILTMIHGMKFDELQICRTQEIVSGTLRGHLSRIRHKQAILRTKRATAQIAADEQRMRSTKLPDMEDSTPAPLPQPLKKTARSIKESRKNTPKNSSKPKMNDQPVNKPTAPRKPVPTFIETPNPSRPATSATAVLF